MSTSKKMLIRNFLFHRISDEDDPLWPPLNTRLFKKITSHLKKNYLVVNLEQYLLHPGDTLYKNKKLATILFDDGFRDNIEAAVPILDKLKLPASFYVVTGCIEKQIPTWTYITDYFLRHTGKTEVSLTEGKFNLATLKDRKATAEQLKYKMKASSYHDRQQLFNELELLVNDVEIPRDKMMTWDHVRQLSSAGFSIGSHSVTHPPLTKIEKDEDLDYELKESGNAIKNIIGRFPDTISYPNGYCDTRVTTHASGAGYKFGLATRQDFYNPAVHHIMSVPRLELYNEPYYKVRLRMTGIIRMFRRKVYERLQN